MKKFLQKKLKDQKGMTLIELLAVIVIIAIIAAIAIPAISNVIENSRVGATKSDAQNVLSAAQIANADLNQTTFTYDTTAGENALETEGYVNDVGSFTKITTVELNSDGKWELTGTAEAGKYTVTFEKATKDTIEAVKNNERPASGTVTIVETAN